MTVNYHANYWGAFLCLALLTLLVLFIVVMMGKVCRGSCDPFRSYGRLQGVVHLKPGSKGNVMEEIALQEKPSANNDEKVLEVIATSE